MAKVSDLKDRARAFERRGQIEKALTVYQHIIKHLEGTPAIVPELQLYVKAGDLLLKLEDPEAGLAMYERAAEQLAAHGSAKLERPTRRESKTTKPRSDRRPRSSSVSTHPIFESWALPRAHRPKNWWRWARSGGSR